MDKVINSIKDMLFLILIMILSSIAFYFLDPYIDEFLYYIYLNDSFYAGMLRLFNLLSMLFLLVGFFAWLLDRYKQSS